MTFINFTPDKAFYHYRKSELLNFKYAVQVLKSKIHNAFITDANIHYIGSITIDEDLMNAVNLIDGEQVHVINHRNGERLITCVIKGKNGTKEICILTCPPSINTNLK